MCGLLCGCLILTGNGARVWNSLPLCPADASTNNPGVEMFGQNLIIPSGETLMTEARTSFEEYGLSPESAGMMQVSLALWCSSDVGRHSSQHEIV